MMPDMDVWAQLGLMAASVAAGAVVTRYFSRRYYVRASNDQQRESEPLRKAISLVLKALEEAGIEFTHGADGSIRGVVRNASARIEAKANLEASAVVEQLLARAILRTELDHREAVSTGETPLDKL
jgi:Tfp pilus assembly protein PilW